MANLKRYRKLQRLLVQIELALFVTSAEIARLEQQALAQQHVFVRTACGEWKISALTAAEQAILLRDVRVARCSHAAGKKKAARGMRPG